MDADFQTIGKGGKTLNLTPEGTFKTLRDIFESRGKKVNSCRLYLRMWTGPGGLVS